MTAKRTLTGLSMILKMLFRRRVVLILLVVMPVVFLSVVELTASAKMILFRLASLENTVFIEESQKQISLIFFSVTSTGFLVSFLALNLVQENSRVNRRLVICGYHPVELLLANLLALLLVIVLIASYIGLLINVFFSVKHLAAYIAGLFFTGFVYGCYGLAAGSLIRGKLEGVFVVVLLANIDAGWLQNPMYYAEAQNNVIIRYLPAYFPSQSAIIASFTDYSMARAGVFSMLYGSGFLILSMLLFYTKMKLKK
jgi:hypothetical protein